MRCLSITAIEGVFDNIDNVKLNKLDTRIFGSIFLLRNFTSNVYFLLVAAFHNLLDEQ